MDIESIIPPTIPMWAIFYDDEEDTIELVPIIALALVARDGSQHIVPIHFSRRPIGFHEQDDWEEYPHFCPIKEPCRILGYTIVNDIAKARDDSLYAIVKYQRATEKLYGRPKEGETHGEKPTG
jgi:hypothetical protein